MNMANYGNYGKNNIWANGIIENGKCVTLKYQ